MTSANKGISVTINEHSIESVSAQKHLGITIDKNLIWEQQIDLACRNVSRKLTFMKLLSKYVNQNSLKQYYNSYLLPMLDFGCVVWGNITNANLTIPIKLQKKSFTGQAPEYISSLLTYVSEHHERQTRSTALDLLHIPRSHSAYFTSRSKIME